MKMLAIPPQTWSATSKPSRRHRVGSCRDSGSEIAELALVLPLLFLVILAIFWFGLAFNVSSTAQRAAKQAAQTGATPTCVACTNSFPNNTAILNRLKSVLDAGHLDPANLTSYSPAFACRATPAPDCSSTQNVEICSNAPLSCGTVACQVPPVNCGANPALGVRVSFGYNFKSPVPLGSWNQITIPASAQVPQEDDR